MSRPRHEQPTPAELEVLKILWAEGPCSVRDVMETLNEASPGRGKKRAARAYTSVMSLLNVMWEKGLVEREPQGRAFVYNAATPQQNTLRGLVGDLWNRAFEKSTDSLVAHLLEEANPSEDELREIQKLIDASLKSTGKEQ